MKRYLFIIAFLLSLVSCHRSINHDDLPPTIVSDQIKKQIIAFHYDASPENKTNIIWLWITEIGDTTVYALNHARHLYQHKDSPPLCITHLNDLSIIIKTDIEGLSNFTISETEWEKFCRYADPEEYRRYKLFGEIDYVLDCREPAKVIFFYKGKFLRYYKY